jgi:hypothetical protein
MFIMIICGSILWSLHVTHARRGTHTFSKSNRTTIQSSISCPEFSEVDVFDDRRDSALEVFRRLGERGDSGGERSRNLSFNLTGREFFEIVDDGLVSGETVEDEVVV